jgi:hypothetical protein
MPKIKGGMGFRDLHLFNLALLGKHGLCFITNMTSLCARVLKGRYFPDCNFLEASVLKSASATWKTIVAGREALQTGLIKRVGDGSTISIWEDKWIPGSISTTPMLKPAYTDTVKPSEFETVNQLIHEENWSWRCELVREIFVTPDAEAILNIP